MLEALLNHGEVGGYDGLKTNERGHSIPATTTKRQRLENAIAKIDLEPVKYKLTGHKRGLNWTQDHAKMVERKYRNFLLLMALHPDQEAVPSHDVDEFWHMHILFTEKYAQDCQMAFGRFIHHLPYVGGYDTVMDGYRNKSWDLYEQLFGERMESASEPTHQAVCSRCSVGQKE